LRADASRWITLRPTSSRCYDLARAETYHGMQQLRPYRQRARRVQPGAVQRIGQMAEAGLYHSTCQLPRVPAAYIRMRDRAERRAISPPANCGSSEFDASPDVGLTKKASASADASRTPPHLERRDTHLSVGLPVALLFEIAALLAVADDGHFVCAAVLQELG